MLEFCRSAKAHFDAVETAQPEIERIRPANEALQAVASVPAPDAVPPLRKLLPAACVLSAGRKTDRASGSAENAAILLDN